MNKNKDQVGAPVRTMKKKKLINPEEQIVCGIDVIACCQQVNANKPLDDM